MNILRVIISFHRIENYTDLRAKIKPKNQYFPVVRVSLLC